MSKTIENLEWRYATKRFDAAKKLSEDQMEVLKDSINLSPTSYGLQLFKVLIIQDEQLKSKLRPLCWNQPQLEEASHIFVFCNHTQVNRDELDGYIKRKAKAHKIEVDNLNGYADFIEGKMKEKSQSEIEAWTAKQTYIAASNLMLTAAELKIDSCPMEGFENKPVNKLLKLEAKNLNAALIVTVGFRSAEDPILGKPKVRKSDEELFELI